MRYTLTIDTSNEAFADDPGAETARILRRAADRVERGDDGFALMDINGNRVGQLTLTED